MIRVVSEHGIESLRVEIKVYSADGGAQALLDELGALAAVMNAGHPEDLQTTTTPESVASLALKCGVEHLLHIYGLLRAAEPVAIGGVA